MSEALLKLFSDRVALGAGEGPNFRLVEGAGGAVDIELPYNIAGDGQACTVGGVASMERAAQART